MTSNKKKGRVAEKQFREVLHAWGYEDRQIEQARPTYKPIGNGRVVSSQNDLWGLYDFVVRNREYTEYVQVKSTDSGASSAKAAIQADIRDFGRKGDLYLIAQKVPRKGFILRGMNSKGEINKTMINFKGEEI